MGVRDYKAPFDWRIIKETCNYSISTMLQQSVMYFAGLILSPLVNGIGGAAAASYTAQCKGAKKYHLLQKGLVVGFAQNALFVLPFLLASVFFARPIAMIFYAADADPISVTYTLEFMRYCLPFLVFNVVANLFHHFFRGVGYMKALLAAMIAGSIGRIIISWLLIPYMGLYGYYVAWIASWLFDGAQDLSSIPEESGEMFSKIHFFSL